MIALLWNRSSGPFADLQIPDVRSVDCEPYGCPNLVETTDPGSSRIDVEQIERLVVHDFQNMGVPADENFGSVDS